ncbi:hypothetical protein J7K50_05235 [bacterium]|nr:hypothetical protein [bacterium]
MEIAFKKSGGAPSAFGIGQLIDLIASEYGWTVAEILDGTTLAQLAVLAKFISARKREERLMDLIPAGADLKEIEREITNARGRLERELSGESERPEIDPRFFA